ncbi:short-chain dehydrogenase/reductase [Microdochium trichocladiopsis]|uniref:Short-chain dehydrogenase/reductase n=1 Tax=Microdochium trichocladiopsis TaxID=1682393 RepID=A0A9P8YGA5_9PEZI|nr:short-chain dehydrogenase/reductase [Microdochium trichocladiopsis]KAH7038342.1 short-chain dehydrogenase/reductase [Microdochium trichocladiopsis]
MSALSFLHSQLFITPPLPTSNFSEQTIIVTGANRGIGLEAARHLLRLNAKRVILAVRSTTKGQDAARELEASTMRAAGSVTVQELDMASHASVAAFAQRMGSLDRLDAVILNAGIYTNSFAKADGFESHLTVNVINTFHLALLLLPTLRSSARAHNSPSRISVVSSDRHVMFPLPAWKEKDNLFDILSVEKTASMQKRYMISKLMQVLLVRELAAKLKSSEVILNSLTPGYCDSGLIDDITGPTRFVLDLLMRATARTAEVGGRTLVAAIVPNEESHGRYLNDALVDDSALSPYVRSAEGRESGRRLWQDLLDVLGRRGETIVSLRS